MYTVMLTTKYFLGARMESNMIYKKFPDQVFDGLHDARPDSQTVSPPEAIDYWVLVRELASVQAYVQNLFQGVDIMPNLKGELEAALAQIDGVQAEIKRLTPPAKLRKQLVTLEQKLLELDNRKDVANLRSEVASLHDTITTNQLQGLRLQESFAREVKGFQNRMLNMFKKMEKEFSSRLDALESKMGKVHLQAEVGNLINRLEQI